MRTANTCSCDTEPANTWSVDFAFNLTCPRPHSDLNWTHRSKGDVCCIKYTVCRIKYPVNFYVDLSKWFYSDSVIGPKEKLFGANFGFFEALSLKSLMQFVNTWIHEFFLSLMNLKVFTEYYSTRKKMTLFWVEKICFFIGPFERHICSDKRNSARVNFDTTFRKIALQFRSYSYLWHRSPIFKNSCRSWPVLNFVYPNK